MNKINFFCLPYAGGSAVTYSKWKKHLNNNIELRPLELAGRGRRSKELSHRSIESITDDIYNNIRPLLDEGPFAIFGYSMGSLIGFELCHKIREKGHNQPMHFFAASLEAPDLIYQRKPIHGLPNKEFINEIIKMNGTPDEVIKNPELMEYFLPVLKSDFEAFESYKCIEREEKLNTDITTLWGEDDSMPRDHALKWGDLFSGEKHFYKFTGSHFFINDHLHRITDIVNKTITGVKNENKILKI